MPEQQRIIVSARRGRFVLRFIVLTVGGVVLALAAWFSSSWNLLLSLAGSLLLFSMALTEMRAVLHAPVALVVDVDHLELGAEREIVPFSTISNIAVIDEELLIGLDDPHAAPLSFDCAALRWSSYKGPEALGREIELRVFGPDAPRSS